MYSIKVVTSYEVGGRTYKSLTGAITRVAELMVGNLCRRNTGPRLLALHKDCMAVGDFDLYIKACDRLKAKAVRRITKVLYKG